jgi:hypothetical protein
MPLLSLLIVSRGRPLRFKNAVESARRLAKNEIEILSYVDEDDPEKDNYEGVTVIGPPVGTAKAILHLVGLVKTPYAMLGSDDIEFKTQDWDEKLLAKMPGDDLALVFGADGYNNSCNHFLFSMKWHKLVGIFPDKFRHFGPDGWAGDVAIRCKRRIMVDSVLVEHRHYKNRKAEPDDTYRRSREGNDPSQSAAVLRSTSEQRALDAQKILKAIEEWNERS